MVEETNLDEALLLINDWLERPVRLLILIRDGTRASALPPRGPADGWFVALAHEAPLGRPPAQTDFERQLSVGTYSLGDKPLLKILLDGLPCERALVLGDTERPRSRLAFYLADSPAVVLTLEALDS